MVNRIRILSLVIILMAVLCYLMTNRYSVQRGVDEGAKILLVHMSSIQNKYYKISGKYTVNSNEIYINDIAPPNSEYEIYFSREELTDEIKSRIEERELPFLSEQAYRIIVLAKKSTTKNMSGWYIDEKNVPRKLILK